MTVKQLIEKPEALVVEGQLVRVRRDAGSKSDYWGFAIRTSDGQEIVVEKEGDNPFEQESLTPLVGRCVRVVGALYRGRVVASVIDPLD